MEDIKVPFDAAHEESASMSERAASNESLVKGFGSKMPEIKTGYKPVSGVEGRDVSPETTIVPRAPQKNGSDAVPKNKTDAEYYASLGKDVKAKRSY